MSQLPYTRKLSTRLLELTGSWIPRFERSEGVGSGATHQSMGIRVGSERRCYKYHEELDPHFRRSTELTGHLPFIRTQAEELDPQGSLKVRVGSRNRESLPRLLSPMSSTSLSIWFFFCIVLTYACDPRSSTAFLAAANAYSIHRRSTLASSKPTLIRTRSGSTP